ncbi:MAG: molybdopterin-dependent oxidoreductase [Proteobacteria bacterium]|nr:molybdopterin-dependent oxidoreductase [Pseudomonadota bacterium]MBU4472395.1 molybdopterin-dependent oxidoreductase [Pseudomonadota bacterium]MCG2750993.1 molybdopterin-dependent oxidoreductase [Desulfobacteraceae bacterium]
MKIDRRSFLSLGIGAAAGTMLSPLPWKITDDLSIWSQNWPWTPVPEDGEITYTSSICTLCPAGCGISVRKIGDRVVKIEGLKESPVNSGGICVLGLSGPQLLYSPLRIQAPLKRMGKRGEDQWETISWKDAVSEMAKKLGDIRSQGKPQTVAAISGQRYGSTAGLLKRLLTAYGSPNFFHVPSMEDTYEQVLQTMGNVDGMAGFDIEHSDYVLSFGSGILDGWGSPVRMFRAHSQLKQKNGKLIQVEARLSNTASKADRWVPINPGTEGDLALGFAYVIIQELLYKREWADKDPQGFEQFKNFVVNGFRPDSVSSITGVDTGIIIALAREFASASRPLAISGKGQGDVPGALAEFAAVYALNALVGNLNKPGGIWAMPAPDYIQWPALTPDDVAKAGLDQPRLDGAKGSEKPLLNRFAQKVADGYPLEVLLISGANPAYTLPDTQGIKAALDKIPFIVSFSSFMDETARVSDLILPQPMYLERYEDVPCSPGFSKTYLGLSKPVVRPLLHTRNTGDVILDLANAMGDPIKGAFPWENYEACLKQTLGSRWEALTQKAAMVDEKAAGTLVQKFNFSLAPLQVNLSENAKKESDFPLKLIPFDSMRLANDAVISPPFMMKIVDDTILKGKDGFVEINPVTAKGLKLSEGKKALLTTPKGQATVRVHLFEGIKPGVIAMSRGLGHETPSDRFAGGKGININALIGSMEDPVSGLDATWGIQAKLAKI